MVDASGKVPAISKPLSGPTSRTESVIVMRFFKHMSGDGDTAAAPKVAVGADP